MLEIIGIQYKLKTKDVLTPNLQHLEVLTVQEVTQADNKTILKTITFIKTKLQIFHCLIQVLPSYPAKTILK